MYEAKLIVNTHILEIYHLHTSFRNIFNYKIICIKRNTFFSEY